MTEKGSGVRVRGRGKPDPGFKPRFIRGEEGKFGQKMACSKAQDVLIKSPALRPNPDPDPTRIPGKMSDG